MAVRNKKETAAKVDEPAANNHYAVGFKPVFGAEGSFAEVVSASYSRINGGRSGGFSSTSKIAGMLNNINDGVTPWEEDGDCISVADTIEMCQKAYWNVSIFRLSIDVMTEFANSQIHFKSDNKQAVQFYHKWWYEKVNGWKLGDQFFREWFRSGNVFFYRVDGTLEVDDMRKIKSAKAVTQKTPLVKTIPLRYVVLNPKDIVCNGGASFVNAQYSKLLNPYELERLKNPKTPEEIAFKQGLPPDARKSIDRGGSAILNLDQDRLTAIFCKKQDYEPLAVPMYFPVLFDINLKMQLKKAESVIAKTTDYMILLIKMGASPKEMGDQNYDPTLSQAMQELFRNESVGRVLVADWTTDIQFIIPDLNKVLGPEKYQVVNRDIADGLMNIFFNEAKFADSMIKTKMFLERLKESRRAFIELFLKPEMKRIAKELNFRDVPEVEFETVDLKDELEYMKIHNRLAELGFLTPEETFKAMTTNQLPSSLDSEQSQENFKKLKEKGLYEPITGGQKKDDGGDGRPTGTKAPQKTKKVSPAGSGKSKASSDVRQFSASSLVEVTQDLQKLYTIVEASYKKAHNIKRVSKNHRAVAHDIAHLIVSNEPREQWEGRAADYIKGNFSVNNEMSSELAEIEEEHQISPLLASLLFHSTKTQTNE